MAEGKWFLGHVRRVKLKHPVSLYTPALQSSPRHIVCFTSVALMLRPISSRVNILLCLHVRKIHRLIVPEFGSPPSTPPLAPLFDLAQLSKPSPLVLCVKSPFELFHLGARVLIVGPLLAKSNFVKSISNTCFFNGKLSHNIIVNFIMCRVRMESLTGKTTLTKGRHKS